MWNSIIIYVDADACPVTRIAEHMAKVARRKSKNHMKGPANRTEEDDRRFGQSFRRLLESRNRVNN